MPVEFQDYYQVLGVSPKATDQEIKAAFRALARKYHPDVAKDKKAAEEKFKQINEANEVLSKPESRRKYDQLGSGWKDGTRPQPAQGSRPGRKAGASESEFHFEGTGFSDFFEQFFGGRAETSYGGGPDGGGPAFRREPVTARGQDVQGDILITLDEALKGAMRTISFRRADPETGREVLETHQVRIPAGVRQDQTIRVPGKGGEGMGGGKAGDILLRVRYAEHPDWSVRGVDLAGELNLAPWEAVLGATVPVETLDGTVKVKVPPGTQQGHQLRIRGKGLPVQAGKRGDLYVSVVIQVPSVIGKEGEQLWKQLASESSFNPREKNRPAGTGPE